MGDRIISDILAEIREGKVDAAEIPIPQPTGDASLATYTEIPSEDELDSSPLVDLLQQGFLGINYYRTSAINDLLYLKNIESACRGVWIREKLVPKLREAEKLLRRYSMRLYLLDGYRSFACQQEVRELLNRYWRRQMGDYLTQGEIAFLSEAGTDRFMSPVSEGLSLLDRSTWFTHSTGGSLWACASGLDGCPLVFGSLLEDTTDVYTTYYFEDFSPRSLKEKTARRNRRILFWCMMAAGWINYPHVLFHFDAFGDLRNQLAIQSARCWGLPIPREQEKANLGPVLVSPEE